MLAKIDFEIQNDFFNMKIDHTKCIMISICTKINTFIDLNYKNYPIQIHLCECMRLHSSINVFLYTMQIH